MRTVSRSETPRHRRLAKREAAEGVTGTGDEPRPGDDASYFADLRGAASAVQAAFVPVSTAAASSSLPVPASAPRRNSVPSLAAVLAAAPKGAVVRVPPGVYRERLAITRPVVLVPRDGPGSVTVQLEAICPVLADTEIRGLIFTGAGVGVGSAAVLTLVDCAIAAVSTTGLSVRDRARLIARDVRVTGTAGNGLHMASLAVAELERSRIADTAFSAVHLAGQARLELDDCEIRGSGEHGLRVTERASLRIDGGRVIHSKMSGVSTETAGRVVLADCEIRGADRAGVVVGTGTTARIERCRIATVGGSGVVVRKDATARLTGGSITGTGKNGLYIGDDAHGVFADCEISGTAFPPLHVGEGADPVLHELRYLDAEADVKPVVSLVVDDEQSEDGDDDGGYGDVDGVPDSAPDEAVRAMEAEDTEELIAELDELVGLASVKRDIKTLINLTRLAQRRVDAGLPPPPVSRHLMMMLAGSEPDANPDSAKATVAGLYGRLLRSLGTPLTSGHLVQADRWALVGEDAEQTVQRTTDVFRGALGGVLFIDDAGSLVPDSDDDFGQDAIDTVARLLEEHGDELVVIVAGRAEDVRRFVGFNPGLTSYFTRTLEFEDYNTDELAEIVRRHAAEHGYEFGDGAARALAGYFEACEGDRGNARQTLQRLAERHALRIAELSDPSTEELVTLLPEDVPEPGDENDAADDEPTTDPGSAS